MDGFTLRNRVLLDPGTRNIPFVFLTVRSQAEDKIRGLAARVDAYMTKPFDPQVLVAQTRAILEQRKMLEELSREDSLTRLLNRRAIEKEIRRELDQVRRYSSIGSLIFIDLDHFKKTNDEHGHAVGDLVLVYFSYLLEKCCRSSDIIGRYGGEEFLVYLPETDLVGAGIVANKLLHEFAETTFSPKGICRSFSAGIAEAPANGEDYNTLCSNADAAMYQAKQLGRARIVAFRAEMATSHSP